MLKTSQIYHVVLLCSTLAGGAHAQIPTARATRETQLVVTLADNGRTYRVSSNTRILITLPGAPGGNRWTGGATDSDVIRMDGIPQFYAPPQRDVLSPDPVGLTRFEYIAVKRGRSGIRLAYPSAGPDPAPEMRQFDLEKAPSVPTRFKIMVQVVN